MTCATAARDEPRAAGLGGRGRGRAARGLTGRHRSRAATAGGVAAGVGPSLQLGVSVEEEVREPPVLVVVLALRVHGGAHVPPRRVEQRSAGLPPAARQQGVRAGRPDSGTAASAGRTDSGTSPRSARGCPACDCLPPTQRRREVVSPVPRDATVLVLGPRPTAGWSVRRLSRVRPSGRAAMRWAGASWRCGARASRGGAIIR